MNTLWKIVEDQARQIHISATEMLSVQWPFKKMLHEVVHGVLVAHERPRTMAQGQHLHCSDTGICPSPKRPP